MENKEKYIPISITPRYGVSEEGLIINLTNGFKIKTNITKGYERVVLRDNKQNKHSMSVHRLVAKAFIPNPDNKPQVNHIDGIKINNNKSNLEWNTNSENIIHSHENELCSLSVAIKVYDILTKKTTTYRSVQYLSIVLKVDDKLLVPYILNSYKYPFMGRYIITVINEHKVIDNLNSKNFGRPVYIYDIINNKETFYKSLGIASYYTGLRSLSKLSIATLQSVGYCLSNVSFNTKPFNNEPIDKLITNREKYLSRPYEPWFRKYAIIDLFNKDTKYTVYDSIEEFAKFILDKHNITINKNTISNVKYKPGYNSKLFLGYNLQQINTIDDIKPWGIFTEKEIINNRYGYRTNTDLFKVWITDNNDTVFSIVFTKYKLLNLLKPYIVDPAIFKLCFEKISLDRIQNSLSKTHNIIIEQIKS